MGNCINKKKFHSKITLAIVGLDNAGKTVTAKGLKGDAIDDVAPTVGFINFDFPFETYDVTIFDLGGGRTIRGIWKNYFAEVYGIVYVVDSTDTERMEECQQEFEKLITHEKVQGKPILLLANKQNCPGALDDNEVTEHLRLVQLVNAYKTPCRLEVCAATFGTGKAIDKPIRQGMRWLLALIEKDWEKLNERVSKDMKEKQEQEAKEKKEKMERVRKIREEREQRERQERLDRGEPADLEEEPEEEIEGDPFKRVNVQELEEKERTRKEEKKKRKALEQQRLAQQDDSVEAGGLSVYTDSLSRKHRDSPRPLPLVQSLPSPHPDGFGEGSVTSSQSQARALPPLNAPFSSNQPRSVLPPLGGLESLESLGPEYEVTEKRSKKKKKRVRRNQLSPDPGNAIEIGSGDSERPHTATRASRSPQLIKVEETDIEQETGKSFNDWNFAQDLAPAYS